MSAVFWLSATVAISRLCELALVWLSRCATRGSAIGVDKVRQCARLVAVVVVGGGGGERAYRWASEGKL